MSKIIFCGGGKPIIDIVKNCRMSIAAVYTHPGNNQLVELCKERNILCTYESINDREPPIKPVYIASVYYKTIIKPHVIEAVKGRIFNAHAALLPRHRGRSAVPWAIVEGDTFSGVTYHYIDKGIDTGRIILQAACQITPDETQTSLFEKIDRLVVAMFPAALHLVMSGFEGIPQEGKSNYNKGVPYGGEIDPNWTITRIQRFINAMTYPPYPPATYRHREVRTMNDYILALSDEYKKRNHNYTYPTGIRVP